MAHCDHKCCYNNIILSCISCWHFVLHCSLVVGNLFTFSVPNKSQVATANLHELKNMRGAANIILVAGRGFI